MCKGHKQSVSSYVQRFVNLIFINSEFIFSLTEKYFYLQTVDIGVKYFFDREKSVLINVLDAFGFPKASFGKLI